MLSKLTSVFAPHPSAGPHKLRGFKYSLTGCEVKKICMQWLTKTDGKVQIDTAHLLALRMSPALARKGRISV
ncbi:hypothetical protein Celaphus_00018385 [Cervus elaphus hippelaphus]|uniref:Uncharacterized protein n=1 Tax=Cervus elaphus hippelaphus TaxID=46360 RepID=A0A212C5A8_CEREH|nr:hypothetical protein Celaphus_00018385 [Cervus elaphus hippelaphus]